MIFKKLSPRQIDYIDALCDRGMLSGSVRAIAAQFGHTENTVHNELKRARDTLGVFSSFEMVMNWNCELYQIGLRELGIRR